MIRLLPALFLACSFPAQAAWYLDNESSRLSFISTHSENVSQVHTFMTLRGQISDEGKARLRVELDSVLTGDASRDEQLRRYVFDTEKYPQALIKAQVAMPPITDLAPGAQMEMRLPLTLTLGARSRRYQAELLVTRLDDRRFQVVTLAPLVLNATDFGLGKQVQALTEAARLPSISLSVPVGAVLIFTAR